MSQIKNSVANAVFVGALAMALAAPQPEGPLCLCAGEPLSHFFPP